MRSGTIAPPTGVQEGAIQVEDDQLDRLAHQGTSVTGLQVLVAATDHSSACMISAAHNELTQGDVQMLHVRRTQWNGLLRSRRNV